MKFGILLEFLGLLEVKRLNKTGKEKITFSPNLVSPETQQEKRRKLHLKL